MNPCPGEPNGYVVSCTEADPDLCVLRSADGVRIMDGTPSWDPGRTATDLVVRCSFASEKFVEHAGEAFEEAGPLVRALMAQYGTGEFATTNQLNIQDQLFPNLCFSQSCECRFDPTNVTPDMPAGQQMDICSIINSTTELGAMCNVWYKTQFGPAMENHIASYASDYTTLRNDDLRCANRHLSPDYQKLVGSIGVAISPGCYWNSCTSDAPQLKPTEAIMRPSCAETVCANIASIINNGDSSGSTYSITQQTSCNSTDQTVQATFDDKAFLNSLTLAIIIAGLSLVLFLVCAFLLAGNRRV
jgi:hypothetical protein